MCASLAFSTCAAIDPESTASTRITSTLSAISPANCALCRDALAPAFRATTLPLPWVRAAIRLVMRGWSKSSKRAVL